MKILLVFFSLFNFAFSEEKIRLLDLEIQLVETQEEKRKTFNQLAQGYKIVSEYYSRYEDNLTIEEELQVLTNMLEANKARLQSIRKQEEVLIKMIVYEKNRR